MNLKLRGQSQRVQSFRPTTRTHLRAYYQRLRIKSDIPGTTGANLRGDGEV